MNQYGDTMDMFEPTPGMKIREATLKDLEKYLSGPVPVGRDHPETARMAAMDMEAKKVSRRVQVLGIVIAQREGGTIPMDAVRIMDYAVEYGVRPRFTELKRAGLVFTKGTRENGRGGEEEVFFPSPEIVQMFTTRTES